MLTVKHHTAEFMLQHGVSAERIGLLIPLRFRRRNLAASRRMRHLGGVARVTGPPPSLHACER
jgi:hypothetical protein